MGIWIELRCEERKNPSGFSQSERCYSSINSGPMGMAGDTRNKVLNLLEQLYNEARKSGWKKKKNGWVCPFCYSQINKE